LPQPLLVTDSHAFLELVAMLDGGERLLTIVVLFRPAPSKYSLYSFFIITFDFLGYV
jgi:hypothetical protein